MTGVVETSDLMARLKAYCFPGGEEAARAVRGIKTTQRGEIRASPEARWVPFTAEESVDATKSSFCWDAQMGSGVITSVHVTDAYENGHGRLVLKKGPIPLKKLTGPVVDGGELQRYLAYITYCPAMLLNHASLELAAVGPLTLRVRDRSAQADTSVDLDLREDGCPMVARAIRPMVVGKRVIPTPWSAIGSDPTEQSGMRISRKLEASWNLPEQSFVYIHIELTSLMLLR